MAASVGSPTLSLSSEIAEALSDGNDVRKLQSVELRVTLWDPYPGLKAPRLRCEFAWPCRSPPWAYDGLAEDVSIVSGTSLQQDKTSSFPSVTRCLRASHARVIVSWLLNDYRRHPMSLNLCRRAPNPSLMGYIRSCTG